MKVTIPNKSARLIHPNRRTIRTVRATHVELERYLPSKVIQTIKETKGSLKGKLPKNPVAWQRAARADR